MMRTLIRVKGVSKTYQTIAGETLRALEKVSFKAIKKVPITNLQSEKTGEFVYQNRCYKGYGEYLREVNEIRSSDLEDKNSAYSNARNTLLATAVREGMDKEANRVTIPVFTISE